jgi:hypothetical protein
LEFDEETMALKYSGAKTLAVLLATAAIVAVGLTAAEAAPRKRVVQDDPTYDGPPRKPVNSSYQRGRTRVYVTRRSWLDAGTEVIPGERKFTDYAFPPGYSYGQQIDRLYSSRRPLGAIDTKMPGASRAFSLANCIRQTGDELRPKGRNRVTQSKHPVRR